ncbi:MULTISPECIES: T9SS type A sorting domain-containing protein [unclassified Lentimicrobium]|uniref:T9SS type A sorting domain-containing protein n=1 Tax=unclassified Lentimicrobium TaxID=2677434 RepID=UPI0015550E00|nr:MULTISPECIES: T9SS type A sorting domain-containing protein [unclassified Lentimicrobium]NPD44149.1 T9SS type A sorting domain-containing protein [Lentimicrobium sp. S6]NPD83257.1 T9SS type A sorting domain-containing protein [Lentimicrobium sp. L6]
MKNRFLRFTFVVFLAGLTSVLMAFSVDGNDNNPINKNSKMTSGEYFSKIKTNQHTGTISITDVISARESSQLMSHFKSQASTYQWTSMGPLNYGGPTKAVIIDNTDASGNTFFAGSTSGGLWTSTNYGATWSMVQLDDVLNVSSICQADNGTIYVGTGVSLEPAADKLSEGSTIGKGIYKSTNGTTFELMPGTAPDGSNPEGDWAFIQKLAVDGSGNLFAATNTGLKYFNGAEWTMAKAGDTELSGKSCDVIVKNGSVITAVAGNAYISTGSAIGFTLISGEEEGMLPSGSFGNIKFDISTTNADYIYASYVTTEGSLHNVYVTTDKGLTWRVVYPGGSSIGDIYYGQGLRNNAIAVSPTDEKKVYLGAYDVYQGYESQSTGYYNWTQITNGNFPPYPNGFTSNYVHFGINTIVFDASRNGNAIIGSDGGMSLTTNGFGSTEIINRGYNTSEYFTVNASKGGAVLAGSQFNGVHRIEDNGSKQAIEMLVGKFGSASAETGGYNHISFINPEFVVCSDENGNFWRSEDDGINQDPTIINDIEIGEEFMTPFLMWETTNDPYSTDTAEFVARTRAYQAGEEVYVQSNSYEFPFKAILDQNVDSAGTALVRDIVSTKAFIATQDAVYMTTGMLDYTAIPTWWKISEIEGLPTCMAYSADANYVWVGTLEGKLYRLSNISRAHSEEQADINRPGCIIATQEIALSTSQAVTSVSVDPKDAENIVFTLGNYGNTDYVFASTNGMSDAPEFSSIQGNLPKMPAYASSFEVNADGLVFIGTENGMFITSNFDANPVEWIYEDAAFGNVPVFAIRQQNVNWPSAKFPVGDNYLFYAGANNYGAMYVGTFGGGVYVSKDFVGFEEFNAPIAKEGSIELYPNPAQNLINIAYHAINSSSVSVDIFDLSGKLIMNQQFNNQADHSNLELDLYNLQNGSYIVRLTDGQKQYQTKLVISK